MRDKGFRFQGQIREHAYLRYIMAMAPDNILLEIFQVLPDKTSPKRLQAQSKAFGWRDSDP